MFSYLGSTLNMSIFQPFRETFIALASVVQRMTALSIEDNSNAFVCTYSIDSDLSAGYKPM